MLELIWEHVKMRGKDGTEPRLGKTPLVIRRPVGILCMTSPKGKSPQKEERKEQRNKKPEACAEGFY